MAKHILTAVEVKNAKGPADDGPKYHKDGAGLFLQVSPTRSKSWVFRRKDQATGKTPEVGVGSYPEIGLGKAREIAGEIWNLTSAGVSAKDARDQAKAAHQSEVIEEAGLPAPGVWTFDMAAKEFIDTRIAPDARSAKHVQQWRNTLKQYASPHIGKMPLDDIELKDVLAVLKPIWHTKRETGKRVRQRIERIIGWAQIMGHRSSGQNPAQWENYLDNVLPSPYKNRQVKHMPSMPYPDLPGFLTKLRAKGGMGARALEFLILTAARSGEVRGATWDEIDTDKKLWTIPGSRMKGGRTHKVPLSDAAVKILESLSDDTEVVFPAPRKGNALSDMTLTKVIRDMGITDAVVHGFRSTFKDWCRETQGAQFPDEISELALAHVNSDATRAAYARSDLLKLRREVMDAWAGYCLPIDTDKVVPIKRAMTN